MVGLGHTELDVCVVYDPIRNLLHQLHQDTSFPLPRNKEGKGKLLGRPERGISAFALRPDDKKLVSGLEASQAWIRQ